MSESGVERPLLIRIDDQESPQQWVLTRDDMTIGRGEDSDIVLPVRQISREHIRIYKADDGFYVEDLASKNGTWVNGEPLNGKRRLNDNDKLHLALAIMLQYIGTGATAPMPFEVPASVEGKLRLDHEARRVFVSGIELDPPLSPPQYRLIELLYNHAGRVCSRDAVVETVWPDVIGDGVSEQAIDALVRRLRDRLYELDPVHQYIVTVRGHGFRLDNPPED